MEDKLRVLLFDIETAPVRAITWGMYQEVTSYDFIEQDWYVLCYAAKWLGEKNVLSASLPNFKLYRNDPVNDKELLVKLWNLLDEAHIVIAHNGINFDCKKVNARFLKHGLGRPSGYRVIDTLDVARKNFAFTSNKLGDLCKYLDLGEKVNTGGIDLWKQCIQGDKIAWDKMLKYCKHDIVLLEQIYLKLRPWIPLHPNLAISSEDIACPRCSGTEFRKHGFYYTNAGKYQRLQCKTCNGDARDRANLLTKDQKASNLVSL